ncbi:hypothetical protein NQZ68_006095 [Dissostichus eleginoides]|nr:hypothetical protein NQZ68_006095 [Dissostichus eleginoides]
MAAAIPATNKWLLTKQASVALSGLCDDRHGAERRGEEDRGRKPESEAELWTTALRIGQPGPRERRRPVVEGAGLTPKEPSG